MKNKEKTNSLGEFLVIYVINTSLIASSRRLISCYKASEGFFKVCGGV
jgi:hypothetical protein